MNGVEAQSINQSIYQSINWMIDVRINRSRRGFDSGLYQFHVTTLGMLFTHMFFCVTKQYNLVLVKGR